MTSASKAATSGDVQRQLYTKTLPAHGPVWHEGQHLSLSLAGRSWWFGRYMTHRVAIWRAVTRVIPKARAPDSIALDLGCGSRPFDKALETSGYHPLGADIVPGSSDLVSDAQSLSLRDGSVDLVLCTGVLSRLSDPEWALSEMLRVLKPQGVLICEVPYGGPLDQHGLWSWTGASAAKAVDEVGFTDVKTIPVGTTTATLFHQLSLAVRKSVPVLGHIPASVFELIALIGLRHGDIRMPAGYVVSAMKGLIPPQATEGA